MKLVKKISVLLAAVMTFSFAGLFINPNEVQAASLSLNPHSYTSSVTGMSGSPSYNVIGNTHSLEFEATGLTANKAYTITAWYSTNISRYSTEPRVNFLNSENKIFTSRGTSQKIKLDFDDIAASYLDSSNYLKVGYYCIFVTENDTNAVASVTFFVSGDSVANGLFSDTYYGNVDITIGTPYALPVSSTQTINIMRVGVTTSIILRFPDFGPDISGVCYYQIEYCDTSVHSWTSGFDRVIVTDSFDIDSIAPSFYSSIGGSSNHGDSYNYFKPGMYRVRCFDGYSSENTLIAEKLLMVTGNSDDGAYPVPRATNAAWNGVDQNNGFGRVGTEVTYTNTTRLDLRIGIVNIYDEEIDKITWTCTLNSPDSNIVATGTGKYAIVNASNITIDMINNCIPEGTYYITFTYAGTTILADDVTVYYETPEINCFVTRCYTECLGRSYDEAGHDYWENCLSGAFNGCDVAKEFFFCDEFISLRLSNEEYVRRLYRTFMDRDPDDDGFQYWLNCLRNGASRLDIFYGFINSPEWSSICEEYGSCENPSIRSGGYVMPQGVSISASNQTIAFVARLYSEGLGRDPEGAGLKSWSEALDRGTATGREVAANFFLGDEFTSLNVSNQEFLIRAYRIFMDRPIDIENDPGFLYWLTQLNSGRMTRADIVDAFAASSEFATVCRNAGFNA